MELVSSDLPITTLCQPLLMRSWNILCIFGTGLAQQLPSSLKMISLPYCPIAYTLPSFSPHFLHRDNLFITAFGFIHTGVWFITTLPNCLCCVCVLVSGLRSVPTVPPSLFSFPCSLLGCVGMIFLLDFSVCSLIWVEPWAVHRSAGNIWPSVLPKAKSWPLLSLKHIVGLLGQC